MDLALQKKAQLTAELGSLKETEVQLGQIKSWEPILRGRMPASAVLGAVEQTIPRDVVLIENCSGSGKLSIGLPGHWFFSSAGDLHNHPGRRAERFRIPQSGKSSLESSYRGSLREATSMTSVVGNDGNPKTDSRPARRCCKLKPTAIISR